MKNYSKSLELTRLKDKSKMMSDLEKRRKEAGLTRVYTKIYTTRPEAAQQALEGVKREYDERDKVKKDER